MKILLQISSLTFKEIIDPIHPTNRLGDQYSLILSTLTNQHHCEVMTI